MSQRLGEHYNRYSSQNYSEYNTKQYDQNRYQDVYDPKYNNQYSVTQEPDIEYDTTTHYLTISSRDRNFVADPNVNHYTINFPNEFKNISSIELVQAILPARNNVEAEPYLLLDIDELPDVMVSNDTHISNAFAILQLAAPTTTNGFIQIDKRIHENTVKYFKIPKAYLSKMTVSLRDYTGALFDFGTDAAPPQKELQNTFVFKIITMEKRRESLRHRNVF